MIKYEKLLWKKKEYTKAISDETLNDHDHLQTSLDFQIFKVLCESIHLSLSLSLLYLLVALWITYTYINLYDYHLLFTYSFM